MNAQILIDALVQQVMVLIAQIATSGGLRAPIAHIANQVFVELSRELEAQGVGRKVSADMFGMALRAYQRKRKRLSTRATEREQTLWGKVLEVLGEGGALERRVLLARFSRDDERSVRAVLNDLVDAGLIETSGRGARVSYRRRRDAVNGDARAHGLDELLWVLVHRAGSVHAPKLAADLRMPVQEVTARLGTLAAAGRLVLRAGCYEAHDFLVPLGAEGGWEAAVLDHTQAVVQTICQRLQLDPSVPSGKEQVGGSTYRFDIWDGHPLANEVDASLARFRVEHTRLRERVERHNRKHGRPAKYRQVVVYGGQHAYEREQAATAPSVSKKGTKR